MILSFFIAKYYDCFIGRFFPSFAQTVFAYLHVEDVCEKHEPQFVKVRNFYFCSVLQKNSKLVLKFILFDFLTFFFLIYFFSYFILCIDILILNFSHFSFHLSFLFSFFLLLIFPPLLLPLSLVFPSPF